MDDESEAGVVMLESDESENLDPQVCGTKAPAQEKGRRERPSSRNEPALKICRSSRNALVVPAEWQSQFSDRKTVEHTWEQFKLLAPSSILQQVALMAATPMPKEIMADLKRVMKEAISSADAVQAMYTKNEYMPNGTYQRQHFGNQPRSIKAITAQILRQRGYATRLAIDDQNRIPRPFDPTDAIFYNIEGIIGLCTKCDSCGTSWKFLTPDSLQQAPNLSKAARCDCINSYRDEVCDFVCWFEAEMHISKWWARQAKPCYLVFAESWINAARKEELPFEEGVYHSERGFGRTAAGLQEAKAYFRKLCSLHRNNVLLRYVKLIHRTGPPGDVYWKGELMCAPEGIELDEYRV